MNLREDTDDAVVTDTVDVRLSETIYFDDLGESTADWQRVTVTGTRAAIRAMKHQFHNARKPADG